MSNDQPHSSSDEHSAGEDSPLITVLDKYWESLKERRSTADSVALPLSSSAENSVRELADLLLQLDDAQRILVADSRTQPGDCSTPDETIASEPAEEFNGTERFAIQGCLGSGGMGVVYRALDRERNQILALKTFHRRSAESRLQLKNEFRGLADVVHPNLVALYDLFSDGGRLFFTMELVEGDDFLRFVRPSAVGPDYDRLRSALRQLAEGVHALHTTGKLHRDLKPSNVMVTSEGRVVVLDFGLATEVAHRDISPAALPYVRGTISYMSPEQCAARPLTPASDWYSVGLMLYEALTGRLPFCGVSLRVLRDKQKTEPAPPGDLTANVPADLDRLCVDLLRREPQFRPVGAEVLARLGGASRPVLGMATTGKVEPVVGREAELASLCNAFDAVSRGSGVTVFVHGRSGMGKSTLVAHFLDEVGRRGKALLLTGRCYERESVPFKAVDGLIDALARHLRQLPDQTIDELVSTEITSAVRLFPALGQVAALRGNQPKQELDEFELRRRAFVALREVFVKLARRQPLVVFIDDLQWGDLDSASLLAEILRPPDPPPLLFLGCYRSEAVAKSPFLHSILDADYPMHHWADRREISLDPLARNEAVDLALRCLGQRDAVSRGLAQRIAAESGGSPFFIIELARSCEATVSTPPPENTSSLLDRLLSERIDGLPADARRLLELVAVSGRPLFQRDLFRASQGLNTELRALNTLRAGRLIRTTGPAADDSVEAYHDRIRETVVAHLAPPDLKHRHLSLAAAVEESGRDDPAALVEHFLGGGDASLAAHHAMTAANRAEAALAFDQAARFYRIALEQGEWDAANQRELCTKLGDALANAGRGSEAASVYLAAAAGAEKEQSLDLRQRAASQYISAGQIQVGMAVFRDVLASVGLRLAKSPRRAVLSFFVQRFLLRLRGFGFVERDIREIPPDVLTRIDICWIAASRLITFEPALAMEFGPRHTRLALNSGELGRIARALAQEWLWTSCFGQQDSSRLRPFLERSRALAERTGDSEAILYSLACKGSSECIQGRWKPALEIFERGALLFRQRYSGIQYAIDYLMLDWAWSIWCLGEVRQFSHQMPAWLKDSDDRGDAFSGTILRVGPANAYWLVADDPEGARRAISEAGRFWESDTFQLPRVMIILADLQVDLYAGQGTTAWNKLSGCWHTLEGSFQFKWLPNWQAELLFLHARCALATLGEDGSAEGAIRTVERCARRLDRNRTPGGRPMAALVRAGVCVQRRQFDEAAQLLTQAAAGFDAADMALHAAIARRRCGQLLGGEQGRTMVANANQFMVDQEIRNPDAIARMLAPGFGSIVAG